MKPLTTPQRRALFLAKQKGGAPVSGPVKQPDGTREIPKGHVGPYTARWLVAVGYALRPDTALLITDAGRKAYNAPIPAGPAILLAHGGGIKYRTLPNGRQVEDKDGDDPLADHGYTTSREHAADDLETMDPSLLHPDWKLHAEAHRKLSRADLDAARLSGLTHPDERVAELRRVAAQRGQDVASELKRVELTRKAHDRAVRSLERKITDAGGRAA